MTSARPSNGIIKNIRKYECSLTLLYISARNGCCPYKDGAGRFFLGRRSAIITGIGGS